MADAADSKSAVRKGVSVRVRPSALSGIVQESAEPETESEPKTGSSGPPCGPPPPVDVVEAALATALERAAAAGEWATVQALPWELEARRAGLRTSPAWTQARAALTGTPCWRAGIERLLRALAGRDQTADRDPPLGASGGPSRRQELGLLPLGRCEGPVRPVVDPSGWQSP